MTVTSKLVAMTVTSKLVAMTVTSKLVAMTVTSKLVAMTVTCSSSCFPFIDPCEAGHPSLRCTATFGIFSIVPCCRPFLSTFLPPLPFLCLSSDNHPILAVVFLVLGNLSSFIYSELVSRVTNIASCYVANNEKRKIKPGLY